MPNAYPPIKVPPKTSKGAPSPGAVFTAFVNAHKAIKPYAESIAKWATAYGLDATYLAALLLHESHGDKNATHTNKDGSRDLGLAQINSVHFGKTITPWDGQPVTAERALDPAFAIQFAAWYFGQKVAKAGGDYVAAYNGKGGYNPGGPDPFTGLVPKTYVSSGKGLSPEEQAALKAQQDAANAAGKAVLFDRWAVLGADGRVKFVKITDATRPPANVLKYGPTPLTQTAFQTVWKQNYADTFTSYTGRQASGKEVARILANAPSLYTLATTLAKTKSFQTSPLYKAHAPGVIAIAKQQLGESWQVDRAFIAKAIAENWDQATLQGHIRARPEYLTGPAFRDDVAKATNVYTSIYGNPDAPAQTWITERVKEGWTPDDVAFQLRQDPAYKMSQEYKSKVLSFAQQLGLITGHQVTLTEEQAMLGGAPQVPGTSALNPLQQMQAAEGSVKPAGPPMPYVPGGAPSNVAKAIQLAGKRGLNVPQ
jgi:hypothetical protein